jgi:AAA15 family ATPase/GTPase
MNEHFLSYIEIEQFKCFSNFKAEGFKRVNLIGGKNNVGKTAFIEACYIHTRAKNVNAMATALIGIKVDREVLNVFYGSYDLQNQQQVLDTTKCFSASSNIRKCSYSLMEADATKKYSFVIDDEVLVLARDFVLPLDHPSNIKIIDNFGWENGGIIWAYDAIQQHDKEDELNQVIREFDSNIDSFKIIGNKPQCKVDHNKYRDITEFGDGLRHYISIICGLYACENGYLFIDEIGNGIHYTQHDRLWELILTLSKKTNCQVFAITHSKEMLESFARVAKKLDEQDISYTTLVKNKQGEIKAMTRDYEMLLNSIEQEREVRGW